ncbi:YobA family protein [Psychrobacillus psychrodurans]|uniref:DUF3221 domain-containing protein n=1 Tax=Psychrobacillus psychrodurans TaxID=126157 RepID=UPI001F4EA8A4|nr:DUF3221 domain-containing protein [Psychrobacillus psychrodurans]MCK1997931.1 YobA family protein [Psychrobacillus psychrodurans]
MKRRYLFLLIVFGGLTIFGCEEESKDNELVMEGIVAKVDAREVFIYEEELEGETMILSEEEVISKSLQASYFGFDKEISGIEVGDKVKVWYDAMDTSLPGSGHGTKIEVIDK